MTVKLEYINHLLQFLKNISNYAGIMLNAFSNLYYAQNYASIIGWSLACVYVCALCTVFYWLIAEAMP